MTMEILNLLLTNNPEAVNQLLSSYSTNEKAKDEIITKLLTSDPFNINLNLELTEEAETKKMIDALFYNMQLKFEDVQDERLNDINKIVEMISSEN